MMMETIFLLTLIISFFAYLVGICGVDFATTKFFKAAGRFNVFLSLFTLFVYGVYATNRYNDLKFNPHHKSDEQLAREKWERQHLKDEDVKASEMMITALPVVNWSITTPAGNYITFGDQNGVRSGTGNINSSPSGQSSSDIGGGRFSFLRGHSSVEFGPTDGGTQF